jgi:hypothetical protein
MPTSSLRIETLEELTDYLSVPTNPRTMKAYFGTKKYLIGKHTFDPAKPPANEVEPPQVCKYISIEDARNNRAIDKYNRGIETHNKQIEGKNNILTQENENVLKHNEEVENYNKIDPRKQRGFKTIKKEIPKIDDIIDQTEKIEEKNCNQTLDFELDKRILGEYVYTEYKYKYKGIEKEINDEIIRTGEIKKESESSTIEIDNSDGMYFILINNGDNFVLAYRELKSKRFITITNVWLIPFISAKTYAANAANSFYSSIKSSFPFGKKAGKRKNTKRALRRRMSKATMRRSRRRS